MEQLLNNSKDKAQKLVDQFKNISTKHDNNLSDVKTKQQINNQYLHYVLQH